MNPNATAAIRRAFAAGEFAKARRLWSAYAEQLEATVAAGGAAEALAEAGQLLEWARLHVKCFHAEAAAQWNEARAAARYDGPPPARNTRIRTLL